MNVKTFAVVCLGMLWIAGLAGVAIMKQMNPSLKWYKWYVLTVVMIETMIIAVIVSAA